MEQIQVLIDHFISQQVLDYQTSLVLKEELNKYQDTNFRTNKTGQQFLKIYNNVVSKYLKNKVLLRKKQINLKDKKLIYNLKFRNENGQTLQNYFFYLNEQNNIKDTQFDKTTSQQNLQGKESDYKYSDTQYDSKSLKYHGKIRLLIKKEKIFCVKQQRQTKKQLNKQQKKSNYLHQQFQQQTLNQQEQSPQIKIKANQTVQSNFFLRGFPNLRFNCYLSSSLQALKQIHYKHKELFINSEFGLYLSQMFEAMDKDNNINYLLNELINKFKNQQDVSGMGDAYVMLLNLLKEIKKTYKLKNYREFFFFQYSDGFACQICQHYYQEGDDDESDYSFIKDDGGFLLNSLTELFDTKSIYFSRQPSELFCQQCDAKTKHSPLKIYSKLPLYIITNLKQNQKNQSQSQQSIQDQDPFNKVYSYSHNGQTTNYKILGYCNYDSCHFKYIAKYNDQWIEFDDDYVNTVQPKDYQVFYYILEKQ